MGKGGQGEPRPLLPWVVRQASNTPGSRLFVSMTIELMLLSTVLNAEHKCECEYYTFLVDARVY